MTRLVRAQQQIGQEPGEHTDQLDEAKGQQEGRCGGGWNLEQRKLRTVSDDDRLNDAPENHQVYEVDAERVPSHLLKRGLPLNKVWCPALSLNKI